VGKHSARDGQDGPDNGASPMTPGTPGHTAGFTPGGLAPPGSALGTPGSGRRRRVVAPYTEPFDPFADSGAFAAVRRPQDRDGRPPAGHPEHREHGAFGTPAGWTGERRADLPFDPIEDWAEEWAAHDAAELREPRVVQGPGRVPRPRQEFLDAFDAPAPAAPEPPAPPPVSTPPPAAPAPEGGRRKVGRTLTGIAAAAVVGVVAATSGGQLVDAVRRHLAPGSGPAESPAAGTPATEPAAPSAGPTATPTPTPAKAGALGYDQRMALQYPLDPDLRLSGSFTTVPGHQPAPGKGKVLTFRVDVERGLPLDAQLFSDAVYRTLNDERGWGHGGTMTFERVSTGHADIVVTLASPGTTAKWCAKSGLDTRVENVSCDAASTPRTMINAYRWARGAETFGASRMEAYRQMLINHEVGHRLGHHHEGCPSPGAPAPVMMQQTKFLSLNGGPTCEPNPWPFP
jgi:hypothetical protein